MRTVVTSVASAFLVVALASPASAQGTRSGRFEGPKANSGTVVLSSQGGKYKLTLSDDFTPPDTPDPHWQVVDSKGQAFLLDKLMIKGDRLKKSIELPAYIRDVAKVQMWCAWAETNLGEAAFRSPVSTH